MISHTHGSTAISGVESTKGTNFPEEFQKKFEEIMEELIVEEARHDEGRAISTLKGISNQTAQEIAGKIVKLYQGVEDKYSADQLSQLTRD